MTSVTRSLLAGTMLASFAATAASAADMPAPPPIVIQQPLPVQECCETWYLRGDIGMSQQKVKSIHNIQFDTATNFRFLDSGGFDAAPFFGIGFGYQFNNWFRADFTGEYRGKAGFHALDSFSNAGTINTNEYTASKSEWLFLLNAYADLGTWWHITPFVGAGIGTTRNTIDHYRDNNIIAGGGGWAPSASKWQFAWALHAGLAYKVTNNVTAEFAYRYLNLGDAETGDPLNLNGTNQVLNNPTRFNTITSHDLKFGLRWSFCCEADAYRPLPQPQVTYTPPPPQVYARPAPVYVPQPSYQAPPQPVYQAPQPVYPDPNYAPQPTYQQPPLSRRG